MDPYLQQIGLQCKAERKALGLNQTNAALKAGISRREVSEIENGSFRGSVLKVQQYAMSLGFTLALVMKRRPGFAELQELFDED